MKYELDGRIKLIKEAQTFGSKGFTKREFIVTVPDSKYPQDIALECQGDKCALLDAVHEGQEITAHFDIRGREYNGRYFNNLVCWRIDSDAQEASEPEEKGLPLPDGDLTDEEPLPF